MKQPTTASPSTLELFELPFFAGTSREVEKILADQLTRSSDKPFTIFTPNPEQVVQAQHQPEFRRTLQTADLLLPDGAGIVWASRQLHARGSSMKERIPGVQICQHLLRHYPNKKILLIGGHGYGDGDHQEISVEGRTVFWLPGYQNVSTPTREEEANVLTTLKQVKPDIVFVAFGAPHQEKWVVSHLEQLANAKVNVVMVVGGAFDMLVGKLKRAPKTWQNLNLEWLYRLFQQPWRWRRQLKLIEFVQLTLGEKFSR